MNRFKKNIGFVDNTRKDIDTLYLERAKAIILYPSLCMPSMISTGQEILLVLLANKTLIDSQKTYVSNHTTLMQKRINLQLRYSYMQEIKDDSIGVQFSSLPKIIKTFPIKLNADLCLKSEEHNFKCIISKDALENYNLYGYSNVIFIAQKHYLDKPVFMQWLNVSNDDVDKLVIDSDSHNKIIKELLIDFGVKESTIHNIRPYHPVFSKTEADLGVGHLSDLHISSRVSVLEKNKELKDISGNYISNNLHNPIRSVKDILWQFGRDDRISCVWITGDVVDFHVNISDISESEVKTTDALELLDSDKELLKIKGALYIDVQQFYQLIVKFYLKFEKPVFFIFGNHDAYEMPYGISPRVLQSKISKKGVKANSTIPMDHNLTFYEAILLFGPGYSRIVTKHHLGEQNYKAKLRKYYFLVITPVLDIKFNYKDTCFIGVDWGDEESIVEPVAKMAGTLPRASSMLNNNQKELISFALKEQNKIYIFMHAPIINYDYSINLSSTVEVKKHNVEKYSKYDTGSFKGGKKWLLDLLLRHCNKVVVFSGHSHRFSMYTIEDKYNRYLIRANGDDVCCLNPKVSLVVSSSAGPMAAKNIAGEWMGLGIEAPSGSALIGGRIYKTVSNSCNTIPRACVILDGIDILSFSKPLHIYPVNLYQDYLDIVVDERLNCNLEKISLLVFHNSHYELLRKKQMKLIKLGHNKYRVSPFSLLLKEKINRMFLEICVSTFSDSVCTKDPWILHIELEELYAGNSMLTGYRVARNKKYGEIPDFNWHMQSGMCQK